ncbi:MAG: MoaD/ThiS family protein [Clostridia bacterium]|nr:MoaD/ThiS family protein [Clostridia bacterium]
MVKVKYYGFLSKKLPQDFDEDGFATMQVEGLTVEALLLQTDVDIKMRMVVLVNEHRELKSYVLKDGDVITVMPLVAGG